MLGVDAAREDDELARDLRRAFRTRSAVDWAAELDTAAGVPCAEAREHTDDWWADPMSVANGWVTACEHPVWGTLTQPGPFVTLSATPGHIRGAPPIVGAQTDEVLADIGCTEGEIAEWRALGVVAG